MATTAATQPARAGQPASSTPAAANATKRLPGASRRRRGRAPREGSALAARKPPTRMSTLAAPTVNTTSRTSRSGILASQRADPRARRAPDQHGPARAERGGDADRHRGGHRPGQQAPPAAPLRRQQRDDEGQGQEGGGDRERPARREGQGMAQRGSAHPADGHGNAGPEEIRRVTPPTLRL